MSSTSGRNNLGNFDLKGGLDHGRMILDLIPDMSNSRNEPYKIVLVWVLGVAQSEPTNRRKVRKFFS